MSDSAATAQIPAPDPGAQPAVPAAPAPAPAPVDLGPVVETDLVYVDPETKEVVGRVEWSRNGNPKSRVYPKNLENEREARRGRKHYPFGTYKSMRNVFRLEGKQKKSDNSKTLDEILPKALEQPFWD